MRNAGAIIVLVCLVAVTGSVPVTAAEASQSRGLSATRADGHVLIKYNPEKARNFLKGKRGQHLNLLGTNLRLPGGAQLEENGFARWAKEKRAHAGAAAADETPDLDQFMYLKVPPGMTPEQCVERLKNHPLIEYVEIDRMGWAGATYPTDPDYADYQWHIGSSLPARIYAPEAWDITTGSVNVIVAVLDTGCNTNLAEFSGRTVPGYNFAYTNSNTSDDHLYGGHGTAVAGVIGANANNGANGAGVDWRCRLMPVKVLRASGGGYYSHWAAGTSFAVSNGAKIINLSAGGADADVDLSLSNAIVRAVSNGAIFVTITQNWASNGIAYPGSHPDAIAVGAVDTFGRRCPFSNRGAGISLVAPGTNIASVGSAGITYDWWGTSFAGPQVAGVAALLCSINPGLSNEQVRALLCAGAVDQVSGDVNDANGYDLYYGWGVLNAYNSLQLLKTTLNPLDTDSAGKVTVSWGCPNNAGDQKPFRLEYTPSLTGKQWTATNDIIYGVTSASWVDDNAPDQTSRFYRVTIPRYTH